MRHRRPIGIRTLGALTILTAALWLRPATADASLQLSSEDRQVGIERVHREDVFSSCIPFLDPFCQPDSTTTTVFEDDDTAPDPGPWSGMVSAPPGSSASQDSEIGSALIEASGSHVASSVYSNSGGFPITFVSEDHASHTSFSATFELAETHGFSLTGSVTTEGAIFSSSNAFVRLIGPGSQLVAEVAIASDPNCVDPSCFTVGPEPIDAAGTLAPGTYTLEASASGTAAGAHSPSGSFGSGHAGHFDLSFQLTGPPAVPALPPPAIALLAATLLALARFRLRRSGVG